MQVHEIRHSTNSLQQNLRFFYHLQVWLLPYWEVTQLQTLNNRPTLHESLLNLLLTQQFSDILTNSYCPRMTLLKSIELYQGWIWTTVFHFHNQIADIIHLPHNHPQQSIQMPRETPHVTVIFWFCFPQISRVADFIRRHDISDI